MRSAGPEVITAASRAPEEWSPAMEKGFASLINAKARFG
jgi:hypothetical protein